MSLKYAIYPPKMAGNDQVYYKDIIILCIEDNKIIGARKYDYDGNAKVVSYLDLPFTPNLNTDYDKIADFDTSRLLNSAVRTTWTFETEAEAYIQKLWCLKSLREHFNFKEKENRVVFDTKIPEEINQAFSKAKEKNPEYFLQEEKLKQIKVGDEFQYNSEVPEHSFNFIVFGIHKENLDIIIDRDNNPSLYKLKINEIGKCERMNNDD